MVDWVHRHAAHVRPHPDPRTRAGLAQHAPLPVLIAHLNWNTTQRGGWVVECVLECFLLQVCVDLAHPALPVRGPHMWLTEGEGAMHAGVPAVRE